MEVDVDVLWNRPASFELRIYVQKLITIVLSYAYGLALIITLMTRNRRCQSYPVLSCEY